VSTTDVTVADMVTVLDPDLYPEGLTQGYATDGCIDLRVRVTSIWLEAHKTYWASLGVAIDVPEGHVAFVLPRSSAAYEGLIVPTTVVDPGYEGEVHAPLTSAAPTRYSRGEAFVQLCVVPVVPPGASPRKSSDRGTGSLASSDTKGPTE
jgi:deoxycytidine triphosphate deaminase